MVVDQDYGGGGAGDGGLEHLSRVDERSGQRSDADEIQTRHAVLPVQQNGPEVFAVEVSGERGHQSRHVTSLSHLLVPLGRHASLPNQRQTEASYTVRLDRLDWFLLSRRTASWRWPGRRNHVSSRSS